MGVYDGNSLFASFMEYYETTLMLALDLVRPQLSFSDVQTFQFMYYTFENLGFYSQTISILDGNNNIISEKPLLSSKSNQRGDL